MANDANIRVQFTEEESDFIKEFTRTNLIKLNKTKEDLIKEKSGINKDMDISAALTFTDFVSSSMQWLMNNPNVIFGKVEDKNAFIVITLLRDIEELDNGIDAKLKMSIMGKVAGRLQEVPRLKPHLPL